MKILLTLPVYNEEKILIQSVQRLFDFMQKKIDDDWQIVIANNASIDATKQIANNLAKKYNQVKVEHLEFKGRGNALNHVWQKYQADIFAYCDIDLATDINNLVDLFKAIKQGDNLAIGSRYIHGAQTKRTLGRLIYSKVYIWLIKLFFQTKINDFQCGFKAVDQKTVLEILPLIKDKEWFWDTELLLLAEQKGYKIKEVPVSWQENKETKVKFAQTIYNYIKNLIKFKLQK